MIRRGNVFGAGKPTKLKIQHRKELGTELIALRSDPAKLGILWEVIVVVDEAEAEAKRRSAQFSTPFHSRAPAPSSPK